MSHPCSTMEFTHEELDNALDLIDASLNLYEDERSRQDQINNLKVLGDLFSPKMTLESMVMRSDGKTTIHYPTILREAVVRIVEMKNEIGEGGSDPIVQAECGFVLICSSKEVALFLVTLACTHACFCSTNR